MGERIGRFDVQTRLVSGHEHEFARILGQDFLQFDGDRVQRFLPRDLDPLGVDSPPFFRIRPLHRETDPVRVVQRQQRSAGFGAIPALVAGRGRIALDLHRHAVDPANQQMAAVIRRTAFAVRRNHDVFLDIGSKGFKDLLPEEV